MLPTIHLGSWHISTYALCYALMYGVIGIYGFKRMQLLAVAPDRRAKLILFFILGLFAGTQVDVIVSSIQYRLQMGVWLRQGHISAVWGLFLGIGIAFWALKHWDIPMGRAFDLGVLPIPLGQAIGRLGCLAAGCCGGAQALEGWGVYMPDDHGVWLYRYPTQPISVISNLLIFLILLILDRQPVGSRFRPFDGSHLGVYTMLFCAKRFTVEFLRADYRPILGPFSSVHLATLSMFILVLGIWFSRMNSGAFGMSKKAA